MAFPKWMWMWNNYSRTDHPNRLLLQEYHLTLRDSLLQSIRPQICLQPIVHTPHPNQSVSPPCSRSRSHGCGGKRYWSGGQQWSRAYPAF
ncbi:hypothetical protein FGIG_12048 [Fasciola gigantica]|uniref:Uncharacterized protein n=1 Tax=Fasciola gigantica TaxID=46835 RepID=A0A504YP21_FASGI|nr:hypothetical protein FGIG_12048 [Fasciola gigantica]